ncbi:MAG: glycosyltransferase family 39 protein [Desulfosporosinus sp.]|nr:glycosyltransferase family 39 protein [Desulfosporosinus sp.]
MTTLWSYSSNAQSTQTNTVSSNIFSSQSNPLSGNMSPKTSQSPLQAPSADTSQTAPNHGARPNGMANGSVGASYTTQIAVYAVAFLMFFVAAYYLITKKKLKIQPSKAKILILTLLGVGLLLRIPLALVINGHPFDLNTFKNWATTAASNFSQFYQSRNASDYPPVYIYVLFLIGKIGSVSALSPYFTLLLKLPSIIADIATSFLIYKLAKKYLSLEISILLAAFYTFNPAVLINSTIWGQVDSFFTLIIVAAIVLLSEKKIGLASILFTSAVLMKPQGIIFLPVLFFELIRQKTLKSWIKVIISTLITAIVIVLPFSLNTNVLWIFKLFASTLAEYPYASVNAFNFFSLIGANFAKDAGTLFVFSYHSWGLMAIVAITAFSWFLFIKGNSRVYASAVALLLIDGVFTFSTRMHERYMFPAVALSILTFIYLRDKRLMLLAAGFSTTIYINTHFVLYETQIGINSVAYGLPLIVTSLFNVLLFVYLIKVLYDIVQERRASNGVVPFKDPRGANLS